MESATSNGFNRPGHNAPLAVHAKPRWNPLVIPGYTRVVKTAISVPDETFHRVSRRAKDLGLSRSEFFARAAASYLDELDANSVTAQIDAALDQSGGFDESSAAAVKAAHGLLFETNDDEW